MFGISRQEFDDLKERVNQLETDISIRLERIKVSMDALTNALKTSPSKKQKKNGNGRKRGRKPMPRAEKVAKWRSEGRCIRCGKKATIKKNGKLSTLCRKHMKLQAERSKKYQQK